MLDVPRNAERTRERRCVTEIASRWKNKYSPRKVYESPATKKYQEMDNEARLRR